jgi:hypothetical protein
MKKSTLIFITGNVLVMSMSIVLMLGLRFKINRGDIIDIRAEHEAETKKEKFEDIERIELNSTNRLVTLSIYMDTTNEISIDTGDYKYLSYTIKNKTLVINYNFNKDSIENYIPGKKDDEIQGYEDDSYNGSIRNVRLIIKTGLKSIKLDQGKALLHLSKKTPQRNDIEISQKGSHFEFVGTQDNDYTYESDLEIAPANERWDSLDCNVKVSMSDSELEASLSYVKNLEIESRNSKIRTYNINFARYDLKLDENTETFVNIAKLKKMNITYIK